MVGQGQVHINVVYVLYVNLVLGHGGGGGRQARGGGLILFLFATLYTKEKKHSPDK